MDETITIELPAGKAAALLLIARRITFDDCLRLTNGYGGHPETGNSDQAYKFINALGALRDAIESAD